MDIIPIGGSISNRDYEDPLDGQTNGKLYFDFFGPDDHAFALHNTDVILTHMGEYLLDATTEVEATNHLNIPSNYLVFQDPQKCVSCPLGMGAFEGKYCDECPYGQAPVNGICRGCPPGTEVDRGVCVSCPIGKYNDEEGKSCASCPDHTTTLLVGATSSDMCVSCDDGYEVKENMQCGQCEVGSAGTGGTCTACHPKAANELRTQCVSCNEGSGSVNGICNICPPGTRSVASGGSYFCEPCPAGTYQESEGQASCTDCPLGHRY